MKEFVLSSNKKTKQHWIFYFQIAPKYLKYFMTNLLNIIFWRFCYMITRLWNLVQLSLYSTSTFRATDRYK